VREPAAWLATIARNECAARARRRMREPLPLDADDAASSSDPVAEAIRRADLQALWVAISALPPQQRDALLLREFAGLSYAELAQALAVSEPAVESLLSRARTRLRERVAAVSLPAALGRLLGVLGSAGGAAKLTATAVTVAVVAGGADVAPRVAHRELPRAHAHATVVKRARQVVKPEVVVVPQQAATIRPAPAPKHVDGARHEGRPAETRKRDGERETTVQKPTVQEAEPVVTIATTSGNDHGDSSGGSEDSSEGSSDGSDG
jgi:hypothetical protein